jgi:hypothetical protein
MLWTKAWLETRWRFLIGFGLLLCSAAGTVLQYPMVVKLIPLVPTNVGGMIGERIREAAELARTYRGFIWSKWFRENASHTATFFAVLLGMASLLSPSRGALFTLSMPVTRRRLVGVRAAAGLAELFVLALIPSLLIPLLSPTVGESYSLGSTLIHSFCLFVACSVFFTLAFLLSTVFDDIWRPLLITLGVAFALAMVDQILDFPAHSLFGVMSGATYFRGGGVPWGGLLVSAAASALLYYGAVTNIARRDF